MKVVLFCGGVGMRMREFSESIPKPMVNVGHRPILWHIMKYYAHFGHKEFILCLGWKSHVIKEYFLNYDECLSNDFVLSGGDATPKLLASDIHDWKITFVDTGMRSSIGQRLKAVERHVRDEEIFLANYADGLSDVHLPNIVDLVQSTDAVASFLCVRPSQSFHTVDVNADGSVTRIEPVDKCDVWMNGGFFAFRNEIFKYLQDGEDLVEQPFRRLIVEKRLRSYLHDGFWSCMDTFKEKQGLDEMYSRGHTPWELWKHDLGAAAERRAEPVPLVEMENPNVARNLLST